MIWWVKPPIFWFNTHTLTIPQSCPLALPLTEWRSLFVGLPQFRRFTVARHKLCQFIGFNKFIRNFNLENVLITLEIILACILSPSIYIVACFLVLLQNGPQLPSLSVPVESHPWPCSQTSRHFHHPNLSCQSHKP